MQTIDQMILCLFVTAVCKIELGQNQQQQQQQQQQHQQQQHHQFTQQKRKTLSNTQSLTYFTHTFTMYKLSSFP